MIIDEDDYLAHYGILRRSGRYPWGSGGPKENAGPHSFLGYVDELHKQGMSEREIARALDTTVTQLRQAKTIAKSEMKASQRMQAQRLKEKGMSNVAIGERMKMPESSVRALLKEAEQDKADVLTSVSNMLKDQVEKKTYLDVGAGTELHLPVPGLSNTKLNTAVARLQEEGYRLHYVKIPQPGTGYETTFKVLTKDTVTPKELWANRDKIQQVAAFTNDGGASWLGVHPPLSISSKRLGINYAEDGGSKADGVIYVRPGVPDVSLGKSRYAQVRIAVDGSHFIKGMAIYKDDLPPGVDLVFNTNKKNTGNKLDALKPLKKDASGNIDMDNPFGSTIKPGGQQIIKDHTGKEHVVSAMNIVNEQGDWETWSRTLSSQMLSKQSPVLAKQQLDLTYENKKADFDEIMSLTNPVVRQHLLSKFADDADSSAVHLKAAGLPRQAQHVIIPVSSLKDNEIYAPNFRPGERVVLIRHPHGGTFEIPELVVNNSNPEAMRLFGRKKTDNFTTDAVGINHKVAERLSGADFDGDTVLVIPNNRRQVQSTPALQRLKDFNPKEEFKPYDGMPTIDGGHWNEAHQRVDYPPDVKPDGRIKQQQMGYVSNLITDMTIRGASPDELARAVRHSMVVIDAEKHSLNWKESERVHGIKSLKEKYQNSSRGGASTLISKKKRDIRVEARKQLVKIDPRTGEKIYTPSGEHYPDGRPKMQKVKLLAETKDLRTLSSGTDIENVYADHGNRLKALANEARRAMVNTTSSSRSPSAAKAYAPEVTSLSAKLALAKKNAPLERQALVLANTTIRAKLRDNPDMSKEEQKKIRNQALAEARTRTGAKKVLVDIEPKEWQAIQAGAISASMLKDILNNTDIERVRQYATPKSPRLMTSTKTARARSMAASGYTQAEIADALGVSVTTLKNSLREGG